MLLRWTSAFAAKAKKYSEYCAKNVVGLADIYIIAIDGSQLSKIPLTHGTSRSPFIIEAVFSIGPLAIEIDEDTGRLGGAFRTVEPVVEKRNGSLIFKESFFRPEFSGISAVLGCYVNDRDSDMLSVQVAYNPLAQNPIEPGCFGSEGEEWTAALISEDADGAEWSVYPIGARTFE
jgi:hypothetical protein